VADIAATGVDLISVGALTHSAPSLDISLDLDLAQSDEPPPGDATTNQ
jgi:nicotinate-nucleotide pyrophosphorylase (carboxylating)